MQVKTKQTGARECFAHYGHRQDVLDLALHYGHYDLSTPFAHAAPLEIDVEGIGRVHIEHQGSEHPLRRDPPRVALEPDGLGSAIFAVIGITLSACKQCSALLCRLSSKRRSRAASALRLAQSGLNAIGEANMYLLDQLVAATKDSSHPGAPILAAAAQRQASIVKAVLHQ